MTNDRLYLIGRADLSPGLRAAQVGHAAFAFALEHPEITKAWHPNYLILLEALDEYELARLAVTAGLAGIAHSSWREPDLDNQLTAVAFEPCVASQLLCSSLPLMLHTGLGGGSNLRPEPSSASSTTELPALNGDDAGLTPVPSSARTVLEDQMEVM